MHHNIVQKDTRKKLEMIQKENSKHQKISFIEKYLRIAYFIILIIKFINLRYERSI